jgi:hypothetical protein
VSTRSFLFLPLAVLMASGTAYAQDRGSLFVGVMVGHQSSRLDLFDSSGTNTDTTRNTSGGFAPAVEMRLPETHSLFVRARYDHVILVNSTSRYTSSGSDAGSDAMKGRFWHVEGDAGYRLHRQGNVSLIPYAGFGYISSRVINKQSPDAWGSFTFPYVSAGAIATRASGSWSAGLDAAILMPLGGTFKEPFGPYMFTVDTGAGVGARIEVPVTYTIAPKKEGRLGVVLLVAPYYQRVHLGKSSPDTLWDTRLSVTYSFYAFKAGVRLTF